MSRSHNVVSKTRYILAQFQHKTGSDIVHKTFRWMQSLYMFYVEKTAEKMFETTYDLNIEPPTTFTLVVFHV